MALCLLAANVVAAGPRTFVYTNKASGYFTGLTTAANSSEYHGLNIAGRKVLEDYRIEVDGVLLARDSATGVTVEPWSLTRAYAHGVTEVVTLLDGRDALVVTVSSPTPHVFGFTPVIPKSVVGPDLSRSLEGPLIIARPYKKGAGSQPDLRSVVASGVASGGVTTRDSSPVESGNAAGTVVTKPVREATFFVVAADSTYASEKLVQRLSRESARLVAARRARIETLLADCSIETENARFNEAVRWLKASGDALITESPGPGIWAGLYWFNQNWGRDTFISLPGLTLVTGRLDDARRILLAFAKYQKTDERDPLFGRIPNRVNSPTDIIYNTADGTPWFVREAYEYVLASGDLAFAREIYPAVKRATDGTLKYRVDTNGLLVHDDADTWMDAKWEGQIPWSARGNRAVDVQALWIAQLEAAARLAHLVTDKESSEVWEREAKRVRTSFREMYANPATGGLYDHLNADGSRDAQTRPNEIFALTVPLDPLLSMKEGSGVVREVFNNLAYPYGIASLAQTDPNFHAVHHDPRWHFDSAYHNGTVWVWNAGPVITSLARYNRQELAWALTQSMVDQTLDIGCVGTLSELIDAIPRDGKITPSGAESQAWSIAEFLRVVYQDYLGVHTDVVAERIEIDPALPKALGRVTAVIPYGRDRVALRLEPQAGGSVRCVVTAKKLGGPIEIVFGRAGVEGAVSATLRPGATMEHVVRRRPLAPDADPGELRFVVPDVTTLDRTPKMTFKP